MGIGAFQMANGVAAPAYGAAALTIGEGSPTSRDRGLACGAGRLAGDERGSARDAVGVSISDAPAAVSGPRLAPESAQVAPRDGRIAVGEQSVVPDARLVTPGEWRLSRGERGLASAGVRLSSYDTALTHGAAQYAARVAALAAGVAALAAGVAVLTAGVKALSPGQTRPREAIIDRTLTESPSTVRECASHPGERPEACAKSAVTLREWSLDTDKSRERWTLLRPHKRKCGRAPHECQRDASECRNGVSKLVRNTNECPTAVGEIIRRMRKWVSPADKLSSPAGKCSPIAENGPCQRENALSSAGEWQYRRRE